MKNLILLFATIIISASAYAQGAQTTAPSSNAKPAAMYHCPKCGYLNVSAGKCAHCNVERVKEGTYYCTNCDGVQSEKPGKCSKCGKDMIKMEPRKTN
jgi:membrane protease subunit (stomatin/prohibitin family)